MSQADFDIQMMRRAIRLAINGRGLVEPNPMVGCVIVKDGRIIGEGYHQKFGAPHAEPNALASCTEDPRGATAYVTLEPCCHTNKKTPPCTPKLIEAGIKRIVMGCLDPNPEVNGKGLVQLRAAGIDVAGPIVENQCKQLIAPFILKTRHQRPYVTLKWAQSANAKLAGSGRARAQISNAASTRAVHELRDRSDAILVGVKTVINDDPLLTARVANPIRNPRRVVIDARLDIPPNAQLIETSHESPVMIYTSKSAIAEKAATATALRSRGIEIRPIREERPGRLSIPHLFHDLCTLGATHVLVEPGQRLSRVLLDGDLADRVWVITSPNPIIEASGLAAPSAPTVEYPETGTKNLEGDRLTEYLNPKSSGYFSLDASADFVLV